MLGKTHRATRVKRTQGVGEIRPPGRLSKRFVAHRGLTPCALLIEAGNPEQVGTWAAVHPTTGNNVCVDDPAVLDHVAVLRVPTAAVAAFRHAASPPRPHASHSTKGEANRQIG